MGRDASPVLDRYPPKPASALVKGPPRPAGPVPRANPEAVPGAGPPAPDLAGTSEVSAPDAPPLGGLITLDRPFDMDAFSQLLGETDLRVEVPREDLVELLRRVCEFMGFGIYVYTISVRPAPNEMLKSFEVELHRIDFSAATRAWQPFQDRGRASNPFGPGTAGTPPS